MKTTVHHDTHLVSNCNPLWHIQPMKLIVSYRRIGSADIARDCLKFFGLPPIIRKGTATNFKFGRYLSIYLKRQDYGDVSETKSHQGRLTKNPQKQQRYIHRVYLSKSPLQILGKMARGRSQSLLKILWVPSITRYLRNG